MEKNQKEKVGGGGGLRIEALGKGLTEKVTLDKYMKGGMKGNIQDLGEGLVRKRKVLDYRLPEGHE